MQYKKSTTRFALIASLMSINTLNAQKSNINDDGQMTAYKPAPNPAGPVYSESESKSVEQRLTVEYDMETKLDYVVPFSPKNSYLKDDMPQMGTIPIDDDLLVLDSISSSGIKAATPPTQLLNTTSAPWNTIFKLVMRFNVSGQDYFYVCSGWSVGNFHIATAGHCIYNWDPNGDNDTSDKKWADEVWVYPAQTDKVLPNVCGSYCADRPYGMAKSVWLRSYSGWTNSQNYDHDWAVITLDRNMGQRVGWMGRTSTVPTSINFSGYPTETPYVPSNVNVQYNGFDVNNVDTIGTTANRLKIDAYIYGGHSGGPSWKFDSGTGDRFVIGIHSTSNRTGVAHDTLLTSGKRTDINTWMAEDVTTRPPTNKPDLFEELFDGTAHKSINKTKVGKLEDLTFNFRILNAGFANSTSNINIDFYASTNDIISTSDTFLGSGSVSGVINTFSYSNNQETVTIPSSLAAGDYTVGYLLSTSGEYPGDQQCTGNDCSNSVSIANQTLTVENCNADGFENDNSTTNSTFLVNTSSGHSICSSVDEDWYRFTVSTNPHGVTIETNGASGDTQMRLYASNGTSLIEFNDDDGNNLMSKITRECGTDELGPSTYYAKITSFNQSLVDNYNIRISTVDCVTDLIFKNGLE